MNKIYYLTIAVILLAFTIVSCDFFTKVPEDVFDNAFSSKSKSSARSSSIFSAGFSSRSSSLNSSLVSSSRSSMLSVQTSSSYSMINNSSESICQNSSYFMFENIQFYDTAENFLKVRQTTASENYFALAWDAYPGATEYRVYKKSDSGDSLVTATAALSYSASNLSHNSLFVYESSYYLKVLMLKVVPVAAGTPVASTYFIRPLIYKDTAVISSDYLDDFNDNTISSRYEFSYYRNVYTYVFGNVNDNGQVYESNNVLNLDMNTTDAFPGIDILYNNDTDKNITVKCKINVHRSNEYNNMNMCGYNVSLLMNHNYETNDYGFKYKSGTSAFVSLTASEKYDDWIDFGYTINKTTKKAIIYYGTDQYEVDISNTLNTNKSRVEEIAFVATGWYTGHKLKIDDLQITYE